MLNFPQISIGCLSPPPMLWVLCIPVGELGSGSYTSGPVPSVMTTWLWQWFCINPLGYQRMNLLRLPSLGKGLGAVSGLSAWAAVVAKQMRWSLQFKYDSCHRLLYGPRQAVMGWLFWPLLQGCCWLADICFYLCLPKLKESVPPISTSFALSLKNLLKFCSWNLANPDKQNGSKVIVCSGMRNWWIPPILTEMHFWWWNISLVKYLQLCKEGRRTLDI